MKNHRVQDERNDKKHSFEIQIFKKIRMTEGVTRLLYAHCGYFQSFTHAGI